MSAPSETAAAQGSHNTLYGKSLYWDGTKYVSNTASGFGAQSSSVVATFPEQTLAASTRKKYYGA